MPPLPPGVLDWIVGAFLLVVVLLIIFTAFKFLYPRFSGFVVSAEPMDGRARVTFDRMVDEITRLRMEIEELKKQLRG